MRGAWLRSKEMEEIIMTLSMKEKKILYAYGCPSHHKDVYKRQSCIHKTIARMWKKLLPFNMAVCTAGRSPIAS